MAGPDPIDGAGWTLALPKARRTKLREFKVAVMLDDRNAEVDRSVQDQIAGLAEFLGKKRVKISLTARPKIDFDELMRVFIRLLRAATSGRQSDATFAKTLEAAKAAAPGDESYYARMLRGNTLSHRDWLAANEARHKMRLAWAEFFGEWDLMLCPTATTAAFPHNQVGERWERMLPVNGKLQPSTEQMFWAGIGGVCLLPATVAPIGLTPQGLPVGVQIMGAQYADHECIRFAQLIEREYHGFAPPPGTA